MATPTLDTLVVIRPGDSVDTHRLFEEACRKNPHGKIEQDANGDIIIMPPMGWESSGQSSDIGYHLQVWARKSKEGRVFESNALFVLPDGSKRSPDVAWVHNSKLRQVPRNEQKKFPKVVPDFVIEVLSPSDRYKDAQLKMLEYRKNGVGLGWLINPMKREVTIYGENGIEVLTDAEGNSWRRAARWLCFGKWDEIWRGLASKGAFFGKEAAPSRYRWTRRFCKIHLTYNANPVAQRGNRSQE